jgi:hypothetical protein
MSLFVDLLKVVINVCKHVVRIIMGDMLSFVTPKEDITSNL